MQKVSNPLPIYFDASGGLSSGGYIYVGVADADPVTNPIDVFWDPDLTLPADQPLRTIGGYIVNETTPALIFVDEDDYSMRQEDQNNTLVDYSPSVYVSTDSFQPINANLTAIALLTTTPFGRSVLEAANAAALAVLTGIPNPLPAAGGIVTGNIVRSGAGVHSYWFDPLMTGGRIFLTASGASDPTSLPGDLWFTY